MRILHIAFKNINSLSGEHEIDFTEEPFTYSPLFAITGATGSGKSSILDAISLALYNLTPRMGKLSTPAIVATGAILTRGQKEAYAKVTYACKTGTFRSEWHISTARTGNLRDYEMKLYDMETDKALDYKKGEIPKANEERIGLSYDQFNKSVMLAQGEFAEFLKAPKKERGDLLEKITGSAIYRKIGIAVFQKFREQENKTKDLKIVLESRKEEQKPEEEIQTKKSEEETLQKHLNSLEKQVETLKEQNRRIEEILKKQSELEQTQQLLKVSKEGLQAFMLQDGKTWKEHKKLLPYLSDMQAWEQTNQSLNKLEEQKNKLVKEKDALQDESEQLCEKISKIVKAESSVANAMANLDNFNSKYEKLENELLELGSDYRTHKATADALLRSLNLEQSLSSTSPDFAINLKSKKVAIQSNYEQMLSKVGMSPEALTEESVEIQDLKLSKLRQAQLIANEILNLTKKEKETSEQIKNSEEKLTELIGKQELLETQAKLTQTQYEKLEVEKQNAILTQSLEQHRKQLKEEEACPLCGSLEHPFAVHSPTPPSEMENALKIAKQVYDQAKEAYLKNGSDVQSLSKQVANDKLVNAKTIADLAQLNFNFGKQFQEITDKPVAFAFNEAIITQEKKHKDLQVALVTKKQLHILSELLPIAEEMVTLLKKGKVLKIEKDNLYVGEDFKQVYQKLRDNFQKNGNTWNITLTQEKTLLEELNAVQSNLKQTTLNLENGLNKVGFESIANALTVRLKDSVYLAYENKHSAIQKAIQKANTQQDLQLKDVATLKEGVSLENKEEIRSDLNKKQEELVKLKQQEKDLTFFLKKQSELQKEIAELDAKIESLTKDAKPWMILQELIGDAQGRKFNDYAQDMTLTHLLQLSNKRLDGLNKRYKVDKPSPEEGDNLMVIDQDMGNQRRAISTLSGGETFMVSLALALALSDLASKNVQIESMFIDEGFGTLDPESLDQTLDALERLQIESSKIIGIISHVDSLKERISTQIKLTQDGKGYSKMEIVG